MNCPEDCRIAPKACRIVLFGRDRAAPAVESRGCVRSSRSCRRSPQGDTVDLATKAEGTDAGHFFCVKFVAKEVPTGTTIIVEFWARAGMTPALDNVAISK